jgi:hypothetical protein
MRRTLVSGGCKPGKEMWLIFTKYRSRYCENDTKLINTAY